MTSVERIKAILNGDCPDRPATFESIMNDKVIEHFAGEKIDMDNPKPVVLKALSRAVDSARIIIVYPQHESEHTLPDRTIKIQYRWTVWDEKPIATLEETEVVFRQRIKEYEESNIDMPKLISEYEETLADLDDCYLFANFIAKTGIMCYAGLGLENFSYLLADKPDLISRYYDSVTDRSIRSIEATDFPDSVEVVFDCEDIACKGGLILSPDHLRKEFFPRLERLVDAWHRKGIKLIFHTDGDIIDVLPDLIACGIDGLNPLETQAGLDIAKVRKMAPDLILTGGVDCSQILPMGMPDEVRAETKKVLQQLGPKSIIGSTSEVHDVVPLENYLALLETVEQWRW